jgi:uncharacterized protein (DUF608 family)
MLVYEQAAGKDGRVIFTQAAAGDRQGQMILSASSSYTEPPSGGGYGDGGGPSTPSAECSLSWEAAEDLSTLVASFSANHGELANRSHPAGGAATAAVAMHGAIAVKSPAVSASARMIFHITLSWYLPMRHWSHNESIGQAYSQRFTSAEEVAAVAETAEHLSEVLQDAATLQSLHFNNSLLPSWLQDGLVNSVSALYKTGMWLEDGRYRSV